MITDLRHLLAIYVHAHQTGNSVPPHIDAEARAVLADEPAVPDGREPASVTGPPSDEKLLATLDHATASFPPQHPDAEALNAVEYSLALELRKARAVLADWGNPAPEVVAVTDENWDALVDRLWRKYETIGYQGERIMYEADFCTALDLVRQEIARRGNPAPAPPADGEVAELVRWLRSRAGIPASPDFPAVAAYLTRAAELLQRQALVLPEVE